MRAAVPKSAADEAAEAAAAVREMRRREAPGAAEEPYTSSTIHMPVALLDALREAANCRASRRARENPKGRGGRPSVSEIVVELLEKHRAELDGLD